MKKFKSILIAAVTMLSVACFSANVSQAQTIGYVNYKNVESNYTYAKNAYKELDTKYLELQQYLMDKEKQYKNIDSPINKKNFEDQVKKDFEAKKDDLNNLQLKRAQEIENSILQATKAVAAEKHIDIVLDYRVVFTGGVDLSQDVIDYLNANKVKPAKK